ncbi:MAG: (Fe-S)-binding protein [Thermoplasmata archaeon]
MNLLNELMQETEKCINCGFCESVCPTLPSMGYRATYGARGRVFISRESLRELNSTGVISLNIGDSIFSCLECYACYYVCPAGVNPGKVSQMMRTIINRENKNRKNVADMIVRAIIRRKNPLGIRERMSSWAADIDFDRKSDTLLYTGGMYQLMAYSSFLSRIEGKLDVKTVERLASILKDKPELLGLIAIPERRMKERMEKILRDIVFLLKRSGIDFNYLDKEEPYSGAFLYELGYMDEFINYGKYLRDLFLSRGIKRIITLDPHTHEALKILYPKYVENFNFQVYHYLELINLQLRKGNERFVYHQPCHFTMHEDFDVPLGFITKMGVTILPDRNGKSNFCCGGPAELLYPKLANSISNERFKQLKEKGGDRIITACPICFANLSKDSTVFDISEVIREYLNK